jgi:hypothetical protein
MKPRARKAAVESSLPPDSSDAVPGVSPTALTSPADTGRACKCGLVSKVDALFCARCGKKFAVEVAGPPQPNIKVIGFVTPRAAARLDQLERIHNWRTGVALEQVINAYWLANIDRIKAELEDLEMAHE